MIKFREMHGWELKILKENESVMLWFAILYEINNPKDSVSLYYLPLSR